jgi:menaquinone-dependent protoporphyrinogen oxidase
VRDAAEVKSFDGADAVVLGSAIYAGPWLKPARTLLGERVDELASRPTWLFSVGPIGDPPRLGAGRSDRTLLTADRASRDATGMAGTDHARDKPPIAVGVSTDARELA